MGRAYEVRKASIAKTGQAKTKLYTSFSKEIYMIAKNGNPDPDNNIILKRKIEQARKKEVPADIIKRAIDKAKNNNGDDYSVSNYEAFGPGNSTLIIHCLTDNVNRTISDIRTVMNKLKYKLAGVGAVSYAYKEMCVIELLNTNEEAVMDLMIENEIDVIDIENNEDVVLVYGEVKDYHLIKTAIENTGIEIKDDEITMLANDYVTLNDDDYKEFLNLLEKLNDIEDVDSVYHNVGN